MLERAMNLLSGTLSLIVAKAVFVLSGYALYSALSRFLSPSEFGVFLVVNGVVAVLNAVFITGTVQAVSRLVASGEDGASVIRGAMRLQWRLAGSAVATYVASAGVLAWLLNDPSLTALIRVSAVIPLAYAFYAVFVGYLNGRKQFGRQASLDIAFSFIKPALIVGAAMLGFGAAGAVGGFALASLVIVTAAAVVVRPRDFGKTSFGLFEIFRFQVGVMAYVGVSNLLMQSDLMMVKALSPIESANAEVAMYGAAVKLAQVPYSLLVALNFVVFPLFARAVSERNTGLAADYVGSGIHACLALVAGPVAVLAALGPDLTEFVFGGPYRSAGSPLAVLVLGYAALSVLSLILTMVNSAGRPYLSLGMVVATLALQVALNSVLIPGEGIMGAATGTSLALSAGCVTAVAYTRRQYGAAIPWRSLAGVMLSAALVYWMGQQVIVREFGPVVGAAALGMCYLLMLGATGAVTTGDLARLRERRGPGLKA